MLAQIAIGTAIILLTIAVHSVWTVLVHHVAHWQAERIRHFRGRVYIMVGVVAVLMMAHFVEIFIWSVTYAVVGVTPAGKSDLYFAFVNYTTLGYGDILPVPAWQLLGPMTAASGILLFGWSTAVIMQVLRIALPDTYATK
ncbi:potassium channel family protein [Kaistia dalseonensis]|uniref:Potassium channel domain-containing protein n=1 Tax=Kaistia dalseonensis TaxID=410840 RepID=A0ABU0HCJ2_9HYPH|nr:potassium channel family protein [Kaistia dalseonensis]MCX5497394.1 potassium channel family protein [Kaistia dalseonensis]MDQ0440033.1 hypothetical protein [Kaistia dalseonensis]